MYGIRVTLATAMVLFASLPAAAQRTLYVNGSTGNDSVSRATNSQSSPWRTIGRAAWGSTTRNSPNGSEAAQAGDTVEVAPGTYNFSGTLNNRFSPVYNPANQGTSASPIKFLATGVVGLSAPTTGSPVIGCSGRNYIIWEGPFTLDEATISVSADTGSVVLHNATGCVVDGISIDGNGMPTYVDNHTGVRVEACQSCVVRNSTIFDVRHQRSNHNGSGVMLYNSDNTIIENNYIFNVDNAVFIKGVFGVNDPQSGTIVRFNLMVNCSECVTVSDSRDSRIYQNVIRDSVVGVSLLSREPDPLFHPVGDWFVNNTVHNMSQVCIFVRGTPNHQNVRVWNNIVSNCTNANYRDGSNFSNNEAVIDWEHNNYNAFATFADDALAGTLTFASWRSTYGHDGAPPASITTAPMYANVAGGDFRLCTGPGAPHTSFTGNSPARALGVDILDLDGDGSTTDVIPAGAYVTNAEFIGNGVPGAPRNLRVVPGPGMIW